MHRTAQEIGYYPNAIARTLKTNRSYNLGVLFVDEHASGLTHAFFASVLNAFKTEAEQSGYDITFINHNIGGQKMTYMEHCRYRNVDGVCLACVDFHTPEVLELVESSIPCVTIDHIFHNRMAVMSENTEGMRTMVNHICALGHRKIAFIHGQSGASVTESRLTGFWRGLEENDVTVIPEYLVPCDYDNPARTYRETKRLLQLEDRPTCIILPDDHSYMGAMQAAREAGLDIPGDISFVGFDGIRLTQLIHPRLTTVGQDTTAMGREAARCLISRIENPRTAGSKVVSIPCSIIKGETLGPCKA